MQDLSVARKYAQALFGAAQQAGVLERVAADVDALARLETEEPSLMRFLVSPEAVAEQKHAFIQAVFSGRVDSAVVGVMRLLVDKGRIPLLPAICREFRGLWEEHQGLVRVEVQTAYPLASDQEERLKNELQRLSGQDVILEKRINKAMIGGIIVHYRDKIIDKSIRRGLRQLGEAMMAGKS